MLPVQQMLEEHLIITNVTITLTDRIGTITPNLMAITIRVDGDSDNDLQMTQAAGISVCMGNGSERLKQLCDRIAPTVYEDGLAREFAALGLTE